MASLYELSANFRELYEWFWDDDADPQAINDTLESISFELAAKAEGYVQVIRQFEAEAIMFHQEAEAFAAKEKKAAAAAKRLKNALYTAMCDLGLDGKEGLDTGMYKLKVVNNGGKRPIWVASKIEDIPEDFVRIKKEADKDKIGAYLEMLPEGIEVPWAHFEPRGRHLMIK